MLSLKKWRLLVNDFHLFHLTRKGRRSPVCHIRVQTVTIKGDGVVQLPAGVVLQKDHMGVSLISLHSWGVCWCNSGSINTPSVGLKKCCYLNGRENQDFIWFVIPDFLCFPVDANSFSSLKKCFHSSVYSSPVIFPFSTTVATLPSMKLCTCCRMIH